MDSATFDSINVAIKTLVGDMSRDQLLETITMLRGILGLLDVMDGGDQDDSENASDEESASVDDDEEDDDEDGESSDENSDDPDEDDDAIGQCQPKDIPAGWIPLVAFLSLFECTHSDAKVVRQMLDDKYLRLVGAASDPEKIMEGGFVHSFADGARRVMFKAGDCFVSRDVVGVEASPATESVQKKEKEHLPKKQLPDKPDPAQSYSLEEYMKIWGHYSDLSIKECAASFLKEWVRCGKRFTKHFIDGVREVYFEGGVCMLGPAKQDLVASHTPMYVTPTITPAFRKEMDDMALGHAKPEPPKTPAPTTKPVPLDAYLRTCPHIYMVVEGSTEGKNLIETIIHGDDVVMLDRTVETPYFLKSDDFGATITFDKERSRWMILVS